MTGIRIVKVGSVMARFGSCFDHGDRLPLHNEQDVLLACVISVLMDPWNRLATRQDRLYRKILPPFRRRLASQHRRKALFDSSNLAHLTLREGVDTFYEAAAVS